MTLDFTVSRAVMIAQTFAAVLHSSNPWFIQIGHLRLPAERVAGPDSVALWAEVPLVCFLDPPDTMALYEDEVMRSVRPLVYPGAGGRISWTFDSVPTESVPA